MMPTALISFTGILIGILLRAMLPALRKALTDPEFKWQHRYTLTAITAIWVAVIAYPKFTPPQGPTYIVFLNALSYGAGLLAMLNEALEWAEKGSG